jgi:hypothetical protein
MFQKLDQKGDVTADLHISKSSNRFRSDVKDFKLKGPTTAPLFCTDT